MSENGLAAQAKRAERVILRLLGTGRPGAETIADIAARSFAEAIREASVHKGREDRQSLEEARKALASLEASFRNLSPTIQDQVVSGMHRFFMDTGGHLYDSKGQIRWDPMTRHDARPPITLSELLVALRVLEVGLMRASQNEIGRTTRNAKAAALVECAVWWWPELSGHELPPAGNLSADHPFAGFLTDLFKAFDLQASARGQYKAWWTERQSNQGNPNR